MATSVVKIDAVDFEPEYDDPMDEDTADEFIPKLRSTITAGAGAFKRTKGRGFRETETEADRRRRRLASATFDSLSSEAGWPGPLRSIEGWIVLVTGLHEEAQDDDLHNAFSEYGQVKNLHLNLDRRAGFVKGYALIEYENLESTSCN